jgi:hypothetical protein
MIEELAQWCSRSDTLADVRSQARRDYFGYDEPGEVKYMPGTEEVNSRERRFLGWFTFSFMLPEGRHPAEMAAAAMLKGADLAGAIRSIQGSRYVMAMVAMVTPGKGMILKLEDEEFELPSRQLSHIFKKSDTICTHVIPVARGRWLSGPGWLLWPIRVMPGMQANLKSFQLNPKDLERFLQQRRNERSGESKKVEYERDATLDAAVARMTQAAKAEGRNGLIMTPRQWKKLVLSYMMADKLAEFSKEIVGRAGEVDSVENANKWLALAVNIWNVTPQPDRGGKSAYETGRPPGIARDSGSPDSPNC